MVKFKAEDFNVKTEGLPEEQKQFMNNILGMMVDVCNKAFEGTADKEEVVKKFNEITKSLENVNGEEFAQLKKDNESLLEQVKNLGETIDKLQKRGLSMDTISKFDEKLNEMLDSEKFADFVAGRKSKSGSFEGFSLKDVVTTNSMTNSYEGDHLITQQQNRVVTQVANKRVHLRDVITTLNGDPEYTNLAYAQVYDFDRNARFVTENGKLPESSIKVKEKQTGTTRLGTYIRISKRMLKSRVYIRSFILNMLPEAVFLAEDWNILFGDGTGENLLGIVNVPGVTSVENIIGKAVVTGEAGSVKSITSARGGKDTIVEFAKPQDLLLDGMTITFSKASSMTALNSPHVLVKMNDRQILLRDVAYVSESGAESMTFVANEAGFKSVESPNSEDVVKTAFAAMTYAQYMPNSIVLNPMTVNAMESEKDTTGHNLGIVKLVNGVKYIAGRPIIEMSGMAPGKYLIGDLNLGANLVDYTSLTLEWAEDVESKLHNDVVLLAQEEVILPVYMPFAFAYGDLEALKTAITKI